jgi:4-amino-4-deoxy-L-arabinose transferase-like glycosyltransferase
MMWHLPVTSHFASQSVAPSPPAGEALPQPAQSTHRSVARYLRPGVLAVAVTLIALALRFYHLDGRSFWLDELVTAYSVRFDSLSGLFRHISFWYDNMPGIFVLTWLTRGFGGSELIVRLPFAIAGTLNVYTLYLLGKAMFNPRIGLAGAIILAVSPFAVWYSQEARQYVFLMLFTTLQMLFAYEIAVNRRGRSAIGLAVASIFSLYTGYLGIPVTLTAFGFVGAVYLVRLLKKPRVPGVKEAMLQVAPGAGAALATALAYLPWLPSLQYFSARSGSVIYAQTTSTLPSMLDFLGFSGLLTILLVLGVVAGAYFWLRGRWAGVLLVFLFLVLPVVAFRLQFGDALLNLTPRYFACIVPPLTVMAALGIEFAARTAVWLISVLRRVVAHKPPKLTRRALSITYALIIVVLLTQEVPALALSYASPKDDYRGAANLVIDSSQPDSVVLTMHTGAVVFEVESLEYYFWRRGSPIRVVDASKLDLQSIMQIAQGQGSVWVADFAPGSASGYAESGLSPTSLGHFDLVRVQDSSLSPLDQARRLLSWGAQTEPRLSTSLAFLNAQVGSTFGVNVLPPTPHLAPAGQQPLNSGTIPDEWIVPPSASLSADGQTFQVIPGGREVNVTLTTQQLQPGRSYALFFSYRNPGFQDSQRVYLSTHDTSLHWLDTFPDGVGFACGAAQDWVRQGFAFTVPAGETSAIIWLRASGEGTADFRDIQLRSLLQD